jgi:NitT/TauT family transport system substrate-binding protein
MNTINRCYFLKRIPILFVMIFAAALYCPAQEEIKLGTLGHTLPFLQADVAKAKGWLDNNQIKTTIITFKTGKDCGTALQNGEIDAAVLGADYAVTTPGQQIKQLMVLDRIPGWILMVANKHESTVTTPAALKGRNVGITSPGSATDILLTYLLSKHGVTRKEFTPVRAGIETLPDVMRQGGIDAGMVLEPYGTNMLSAGEAVILVDFRSMSQVQKHLGSLYTGTCLLVRQDVIEKKRTAIQQLTNALVWSTKWLQTASAEEVQRLLPREYTPDPEPWKRSYEGYKEVFSPDGNNDIEGLRAVINSQVVFGTLQSQDQVKAEAVIDNSFWLAANQLPIPQASSGDRDPTQSLLGGAAGKVLLAVILILIVGGIIMLVVRARKPSQ